MSYYYQKTIHADFVQAVQQVTDVLKTEGFGIITEIDVTKTLKDKLNVDFRNYRILGACNPALSYELLNIENAAGVRLPCNVVLQEKTLGQVQVIVADPIKTFASVENPKLLPLLQEVDRRVKAFLEKL